MYEICNQNLDIEFDEIDTEQDAIDVALSEMQTDNAPCMIRRDDGEITALIYCNVVYRPIDQSSADTIKMASDAIDELQEKLRVLAPREEDEISF
jgi:hypothetical protein